MGLKNSKLNCGGKGAKEEPYRSVTKKNVDKKTKVEINGAGGHVAGTDEVSKDKLKAKPKENIPAASDSKGQASQGKQKGPKSTGDTTRRKETTTNGKKVKDPDVYEPKLYEFVKGVRTNVLNKTSKLGDTTSNDPEETGLKSATGRVGDTQSDETELKGQISSSSNGIGTDESILDPDCIPSLNSEERLEEFADADRSEYNEQQKKNQKNRAKSVVSEDSEESEEEEEEEEEEDEDSEGSKEEGKGRNYNFGHVRNMVIGTGKIIDRSTNPASKKNAKAKKQPKKGKTKTKGGAVNADDVRNLGIGTVMILDESKNTPPPQPASAKVVDKKLTPNTEVQKPIPSSDMEELVSVGRSVGIIHGYKMNGTVFRVGKDKVMTAWHVVKGMLRVDHQSKPDYTRLADVFVDFNYEEEYREDHMMRFPLEPTVLYFNDKLDIAVLQLKLNNYGKAYPAALTKFDKFTREVHENYPIYLIGHSNALEKSMDHVLKYWHPFDHRIKELTDWSENEFHLKHGFGYTGIRDKTRLLFQCSFRHGASGCPGFLVRSKGDVRVVTVFLRGFPDFYYFANFTEEEKNRVPTEKLIQQGADIGSIKEDMEKKNKELFREIFQYSDFISHTEKHQPIDTPSEDFPQSPASSESENNPAGSGDQVTCIPRVASEQDTKRMLVSGKDTPRTSTENETEKKSSSVGTSDQQPEATMSLDQNGTQYFQEITVVHERLQAQENTNMPGNEADSTERTEIPNADENGASSEAGAGSQSVSERNNATAFSVEAVDDGATDQGRDAAQYSPSYLSRQMSETTTSASEVLCAEIRQQAHCTKSASASKLW